MKNIRIVTYLIFFLGFSFSKAQMLPKYMFPTPGEITIGASTPIPDGIEPTRAAYEELIDCGFNLGLTNGTLDYFKNQFKLIKGLNFKYLIQNDNLFTEKRKEFIKAFQDEPNFAGWKFKDEPKYSDLNQLQRQYDALLKDDNTNLIYINLVGVIDKTFTGPFTKFSDYLDLIQQKFRPEIWSFDYYPILVKDGKVKIDYETFYSVLEDFKNISNKTGRPFWSYCESMAYKAKSYSRPAATEEYLRFEAFTALAYGAQGIVYWTYGQRNSNSVETYTSALVNLNGKKSKAWQSAKKVNAEIKKYNEVFFNCKVKDLKHTGNKTYKGTKKLNGEFGPFKSISGGTSGVIVSDIESAGGNYIVIISRDVEKTQKVTLKLKDDVSLSDLTQSNNPILSSGKDINFTLGKGGYKIYKIM